METNNHSDNHKAHFILPVKLAVTIGITLLFLTAVTVGIAKVDLGNLNFVIAMVVATVKALLVGLFFMGLLYDKRENAMIFLTSFVFLGIFMTLTSTDMFFRGNVYVKGPLVAAAEGPSHFSKPWISTPELIAHGKELFAVQCTSCHGIEGKGNGPAAGALVPPPRNFTQTEGWKNGRKATMIFKTLKEGLAPSAMASYATLPVDDRWALSQYVLTLSSAPVEKDTAADFAKIGVDPTKEAVVEKVAPTIPLSFALKRSAEPQTEAQIAALHVYQPEFETLPENASLGARIYHDSCIQCHGSRGEGSIKVKNLGVYPTAYVTTRSFKDNLQGMKSLEAFTQVVIEGYPGDLMPGMGQLSKSEIRELYQYTQSLGK